MQGTAERWATIPGFDMYEVSDHGRVRSWQPSSKGGPAPRILAQTSSEKGYVGVSLCADGKARSKRVHGLVLLAFVGPRPDGLVTRHLDGDPANNHLSNLAYGTYSENQRDKRRHGTDHNAAKTRCPRGHLYDEANTVWRTEPGREGQRGCRACGRADVAAYYRRKHPAP
jgi:hypothetical protein